MGKVGRYGMFGGQYVPETVMNAVHELEAAYEEAKADPTFWEEYRTLCRVNANRPSLLYYARTDDKGLGRLQNLPEARRFEPHGCTQNQ